MMRKMVILFLVCILLIGTTSSYASNTNELDYIVEQFKCKVSTQNNSFSLWAYGTLSDAKKLINVDNEVSAYLYNVLCDDKIIGYILINPNSKNVIEFALGQSPYEDYLNEYKKLNKSMFCNKTEELVYDGPGGYGISVEGEIIPFIKNSLGVIKIDATKELKKLMNEKSILNKKDINFYYPIEPKIKLLSNVADNMWYKGCGPTAASNIVYYWDRNGYPDLVKDTQTVKDVIDQLYIDMNTMFGQLTMPNDYLCGIVDYFNRYYNYTFFNHQYHDYFDLVNEIDNDRPGSILYLGGYFGKHYVTFVGYEFFEGENSGYYVVHDTWSSTPVNHYRSWIEDSNHIEMLVGFGPV